ncbi:MAG TPA: nuclear transport factor 2 family protein [Candidatus Didemnitutus sp.]|nr:nuclear transport factor 2 family protein [Candidatus Didemnitutus sp.]
MKTKIPLVGLVAIGMVLSVIPGLAQKPTDAATAEKVVRSYYSAYVTKDWHVLEQILADDFTFTSPAGDDHINLATYKARCWPNSANTKRFELEKLMVAGDDVLVTYNGWTNDGRLFRNAELFRLRDGKIVTNECFFGTGVNFPNNPAKK